MLIDEFQDTDPVQAELAMLLTDIDGDGVPEPGRLVVVGDPKQSIYRFRRADIAIYDEVKFGPLADGQALIQQNFRSVDGVLDWVNRVFDDAFGAGERGTQPPHVALLARARAPAGSARRWSSSTATARPTSADEIREQEAERLAAVLEQAVRGEPWTVRDPVTKTPPARDVARLRDPAAGPHRARASTSTRLRRAASRTAPRRAARSSARPRSPS